MFASRVITVLLCLMLSGPVAAQATAVRTIYMWSFDYSPKPIHLAAGRPVTLTFVNRSGGGHDFTAKAFFATARITAGAAPAVIRAAPGLTRAGTYKVHCGHFLHRQFGMENVIVVN
jgi:plastocyanin